jgi:hypothetical protein
MCVCVCVCVCDKVTIAAGNAEQVEIATGSRALLYLEECVCTFVCVCVHVCVCVFVC